MFRRILIANRGEIACRIIDTCRRLGVSTVAVHSDADAGARHVAMADAAWHLAGNAPAETYLRGELIVEAALATGRRGDPSRLWLPVGKPRFRRACQAAGLVFIGPSAAAIRAMGLKDAAKALMEKAGVPVVPGYHGADQSDARLAAEAEPDRLSGADQGGGRRRRQGHAPGRHARRISPRPWPRRGPRRAAPSATPRC